MSLPTQRDTNANQTARAPGTEPDPRAEYEAPRLVKKRAVTRMTLFSGTGAVGGLSLY